MQRTERGDKEREFRIKLLIAILTFATAILNLVATMIAKLLD